MAMRWAFREDQCASFPMEQSRQPGLQRTCQTVTADALLSGSECLAQESPDISRGEGQLGLDTVSERLDTSTMQGSQQQQALRAWPFEGATCVELTVHRHLQWSRGAVPTSGPLHGSRRASCPAN